MKKWFLQIKNVFCRLKMVYAEQKWFFQIKNCFGRVKMVFADENGKSQYKILSHIEIKIKS